LKLGRKLYSGDGDIFNLKDYPDRVVKVVSDSYSTAQDALRVLKYLQRSKNPAVVKLYRVGSFKHESQAGYYYVMDKLKLFPRNQRENYADDIREALEAGRNPGSNVKVKSFIKAARQLKYEHTDIHSYNIMKDKRGNIRFVDLESFMHDYSW